MRRCFAAALLLLSTPAFAAPICYDRKADMVHCDAPSAMPQGWVPAPETYRRWQERQPPAPAPRVLAEGIIAFLAFLAMIALLPRFDGRRDADWMDDRNDPAGPGNTTGL